MTGNPYEPADAFANVEIADSNTVLLIRKPLSVYLLVALLVLTIILAFINLVQEDAGSEVTGAGVFINMMLAGFSGLSQMPGLGVAIWRWKGSSNLLLPLLVAAYVIALTGLVPFVIFHQTEPSDSVNSAAHMHVILFPIVHSVFGAVIYTVALLITLAIYFYSRFLVLK